MAQKEKNVIGKQWIKKEMKPYRGFIAMLTVFSVITTLLSIAFAYFTSYVINSATAGDVDKLWFFSILLLSLLLLRIGLQTLSSYLSERICARIVCDLRTRMFSKILRSNYASVQKYHSGELLNRLTTDITEVAVDTVGLTPSIVGIAVQCVGAVVALLTINPLFTAIYVVCGAVFGAITAAFKKQIKKRQKEVLQADGQIRSFMQESITSTMTIKAYGAEEKSADKADGYGQTYFKKRMERNKIRAVMNGVFSLLGNFGLIFAIVWCSVSVLATGGNADYGSIVSVILLLMQLQHPFTAFSSVIPVYYSRATSAERLAEIEDIPCETLQEGETPLCDYERLQTIAFDNVAFDYGRERVIENASFAINKGEIVCLTGASGSGKSTVFKLLLSLYAPSEGQISLQSEGEITPLTAAHRNLFAYVPQGNFLFSGTILENLTFFSKRTEEDEETLLARVKRAIEVACAEFVWELPQGLQTPLYEGGKGLSEGQMQRLAVARAILSDRPILLLDEATSALDAQTEKQLLQNVRTLQNKTCVIVTHRPAALEIADSVLHVEKATVSKK